MEKDEEKKPKKSIAEKLKEFFRNKKIDFEDAMEAEDRRIVERDMDNLE